jgi:hypothetical protein
MKTHTVISVFLFHIILIQPVVHSEDSNKVAILEFQNNAETIISKNRWTMAEDLAKELRKKNKKIEIVSRKEILKLLKELSWEENRLNQEQEGKLASIGVKYLVYGDIEHWRVRSPSTARSSANREVQESAEAMLVFSFDVLDLSTGEVMKPITVEANASGEVGLIREGDPAAFDEEKYEQETYDATEVALEKAAAKLAPVLGD